MNTVNEALPVPMDSLWTATTNPHGVRYVRVVADARGASILKAKDFDQAAVRFGSIAIVGIDLDGKQIRPMMFVSPERFDGRAGNYQRVTN